MSSASSQTEKFRNSFHCTTHILRKEGIRGLYKGLSASYLGVSEGTIKLVYRLYYSVKEKLVKEEWIKEGRAKLDRLPVESTK